MKNKVALKILEIEKGKLMSEPESNRDWELITALDVAINDLKNEPFLIDAIHKKNAEIKELENRIEFLKQQIRLWQSKEQQGGDCEDEISLEQLQEEQPQGEWVGINEYLKHIEETTGEKYKTSGLYDGRLFCNRCWKMSELMIKTNFCYECGAELRDDKDE